MRVFTAFKIFQQNGQQSPKALPVVPDEAHLQPGHKLEHASAQRLQGQQQVIQVGETVRHAKGGRKIQRQKVHIEANGQPAVVQRPNAKYAQRDAWQTKEIRCAQVGRRCLIADEHCWAAFERMLTIRRCDWALL